MTSAVATKIPIHQIFLECVDWCAEKVQKRAKNTGYEDEVEFNEVDIRQLLGPCFYYQIVLATVINVDVI